MAFLRETFLVAHEVGHDFEAAGNFLHQFERQVDEFREHAAEPDAHDERALPRLDVDVARASLDGVVEEVVDEQPDFNAALGGL